MEYKSYLSKKHIKSLSNGAVDGAVESKLFPKTGMIFISLFLGVFGVDRFVLKNKVKGATKLLLFVGILTSIIVLLANITSELLSFYSGQIGLTTITWADNVRIIGTAKANAMYFLIALLVAFIVFVVIDGIFCYKKTEKNNYKIIMENKL